MSDQFFSSVPCINCRFLFVSSPECIFFNFSIYATLLFDHDDTMSTRQYSSLDVTFETACISAETMEIHHSKHHNTYVTNLNATLEKLDAAVSSGDVSGIISLQSALKFNGGGHVNHTLFWENLTSKGNSEFPTSGPLKEAVDARFGDLEGMKKEVSAMTVAVQGSGWGWLGFDAKTGEYLLSFLKNTWLEVV